MNVLLEVDDRKHVLLKQVLVLHLLRHFSEKTNLNTIDDDALKDGDVDVLVQLSKLSNLVLVLPGMRFVQNFTPPDFQAKNFTLSISPNFNSFSG